MTQNKFSLKGKTILVTGASSGIGREVAISCSDLDASVIITSRREEKLKETISLMIGDHKKYIVADLTNAESLSALVESLPKLDGIVYCAGIGSTVFTKAITVADIDGVMKPNFYAPILLQSSILTNKKLSREGSVVFIASMAATSPVVGNALYSASKGALLSYSKVLALELSPRKIRVNCISPAMVRTDFIASVGVDEEALREDEKRYPLGRYGKPEDIAGLAVYLLSDESKWMTGSNIEITGGVKSL